MAEKDRQTVLYFSIGAFLPSIYTKCLVESMVKNIDRSEDSTSLILILSDPEDLPYQKKIFYNNKIAKGVRYYGDNAITDFKAAITLVKGRDYHKNILYALEANIPYIQDFFIKNPELSPNELEIRPFERCPGVPSPKQIRRWVIDRDQESFTEGYKGIPSHIVSKLWEDMTLAFDAKDKDDEGVIDDSGYKERRDDLVEIQRHRDYAQIMSLYKRISQTTLDQQNPLVKRLQRLKREYYSKYKIRFKASSKYKKSEISPKSENPEQELGGTGVKS